ERGPALVGICGYYSSRPLPRHRTAAKPTDPLVFGIAAMSLHFRVWRRVRLMPGVWMNIRKRGVTSFTFGRRGVHYTVGRRRTRATVGLPGSGIYISDIRERRTGSVSEMARTIGFFEALRASVAINYYYPMRTKEQARHSLLLAQRDSAE